MEGPLVAETTSDNPLISEGIVSCDMNIVSKLSNFDEIDNKGSISNPLPAVNEMDGSSENTEMTCSSITAQQEQPDASEDPQDQTSISRRAKEVNFNLPSIEINDYTEEKSITIQETDHVKASDTTERDQRVSQSIDVISQNPSYDSISSFEGQGVRDTPLPSGSNGFKTNISNDCDKHNVGARVSLASQDMEIINHQMGKVNNVQCSDLVTSKHYESKISVQAESKVHKAKKEQSLQMENTMEVTVEVSSQNDGTNLPDISMKELSPKKTSMDGVPFGPESIPSKVSQGDTGKQLSKPLCLPGQKLPEVSKGNEMKATSISELNGQSQLSKETKVLSSYSVPPNLSLSQKQHIETQVSLEIMCRSAATSPMTPPEGFAAAFFPYLSGKFELSCKELSLVPKKDAELQVGEMVNYRSVATAPMSPIAPSAPEDCPEIRVKDVTQEEQPEPVQEVRWDEKGMTWEVYGAAVEVEVLGIAIQKHLEKQIKEHGKLPPLLAPPNNSTTPADEDTSNTSPSPPLSPPPITVPSTSITVKDGSKVEEKQEGTKKGRQRNPFRISLRSMRRPRCCFRSNTIE